MAEQVPLTPDDRLLAVTTIGFDIAALELYLPLLGGAVDRASRRARPCRMRRLWRRRIGDSGATVMQATPTLWQTLLADGGERLPDLDRPCHADRRRGAARRACAHACGAWPHA